MLQKQSEHLAYFSKGPIRPKVLHPNQTDGFEARFKERNENIAAWLSLLIDTSYRHEAHERSGYVGMQFKTALGPEHEAIMAKIERIAKNFRIAGYTIGGTLLTSGVGAACYYFLQ